MENILEIVSVPVIAALVYGVINLIKYAVKSNEIFMRLIPLISAVLGAGLGIIAYFSLPSIIAADNWLMALLIGSASGLSATGVNQVIKQLGKGKCEDKNKENSDTKENEEKSNGKSEDKNKKNSDTKENEEKSNGNTKNEND